MCIANVNRIYYFVYPIEIEDLLISRAKADAISSSDNLATQKQSDSMSIEEMLDAVDTAEARAKRSSDTENRLATKEAPGRFDDEERALASMSLRQLYEVTTRQISATDYQIYRAQVILDKAMIDLVHK